MNRYRSILAALGGSDDFIFTLETTAADEVFQTPIQSTTNYPTDIVVDWGDGNSDSYTGTTARGDIQHTYESPGTYQVSISRNNEWGFYWWRGYFWSQLAKIKSIDNWGTQKWKRFDFFWDKRNNTGGTAVLNILAPDTPDFSSIENTTARYVFTKTQLSNTSGSMDNWDMTYFLNLNAFFITSDLRNLPDDFCSSWDVSNNTDFSSMFNGTYINNLNLNNWDVTSGNTFLNMFSGPGDMSGLQISGWSQVNGNCGQILYKSGNPPDNWSENVGGWDISGVSGFSAAFVRRGINVNNTSNQTLYGQILRGWTGWDDATSLPTRSLPSNITFTMQIVACPVDAQPIKNYLINTLGWTISDGGNV